MDEKALFKAAREGNISWLQSLLDENPMLLERVVPLFSETPLHVAASAGKAEFVKHLLRYAPRLAKEPSSRNGLNAMHIAVANGHADVVSVLLDFDLELSVTGDSEGSVSLHYAAYHGRVDIAKLLVSQKPAILAQINFKGENALHVAVKRKQNDVMTVLGEMLETLGNEFCNQVIRQAKDENGNTVAQLILASKSQVPGVFETYTQNSHDEAASAGNNEMNMELIAREAMIVIGVLIATVTFQALMSPPQSLFKGGIANVNSSSDVIFFLSSNSVGFLASCFAILSSIKEDVTMLVFGVSSSLCYTVMSYICVLKSMMEDGDVFYMVMRSSIILVLPNLIICLYFSSRTVRIFVSKIIDCVRGFRASTSITTSTQRTTTSRL